MLDTSSVGLWQGQRILPMPRVKVGQMHVVCGSWNPLHDAHRWMYESIDEEAMVIQKYEGRGVAVASTTFAKYFEISTARVGKEDLSHEELIKRLRQFSGYADVLVTPHPYFVDKYAVLRPFADEVIFHIGYDNYERLIQINGLREVGLLGCKFCVWPRNGQHFKGGPKNCFDSGLDLPPHLQGMSSTKIRETLKAE